MNKLYLILSYIFNPLIIILFISNLWDANKYGINDYATFTMTSGIILISILSISKVRKMIKLSKSLKSRVRDTEILDVELESIKLSNNDKVAVYANMIYGVFFLIVSARDSINVFNQISFIEFYHNVFSLFIILMLLYSFVKCIFYFDLIRKIR